MFSRFPFAEIDTNVFSAGYASGRTLWLDQLETVPCFYQHLSFRCEGTGPAGEELVTDALWLGDRQAENALVVLSGSHGIEGFAGSAIQTDLLRLLNGKRLTFPERTAILIVHALTPWGYAWSRRCDENGVDLNRNAVDFSMPLPENPGYEMLKPAIYCENLEQRRLLFDQFIRAQGRTAFEIAISGGQYVDPLGPFFGGKSPAHGRVVCEALIEHYGLADKRLAVVDLHTGLGPYGYGEIICDHDPGSSCAEIARRWYGESASFPLAGTSSSVPKHGLLDYLWHTITDDRSCYVTLEFGTYSTDRLFDVLLCDHLLWAQEELDDTRLVHSLTMRHHFCPNDNGWQEMVLLRARQVLAQALNGVSF